MSTLFLNPHPSPPTHNPRAIQILLSIILILLIYCYLYHSLPSNSIHSFIHSFIHSHSISRVFILLNKGKVGKTLNKMLHLLYGVILAEVVVIVSLLFKTPLRKLVIVTLDRVKRGRGPVVVKTIGGTVGLVLASSLYTISQIRSRIFDLETGLVNPTDQVLLSKNILEASLMGFVLFLSLMIDRLHHYIRELRVLRKTLEAAKKQSRAFEDGKNGNAKEHKALLEEIATLKPQVKKLESECEVRGSKIKTLEAEVEALKKQSEGFLLEYDRLLEDNQSLRSQIHGIDKSSSHLDDKKSM